MLWTHKQRPNQRYGLSWLLNSKRGVVGSEEHGVGHRNEGRNRRLGISLWREWDGSTGDSYHSKVAHGESTKRKQGLTKCNFTLKNTCEIVSC